MNIKITKKHVIKTLFFISIMISIIVIQTISMASAGQIDVNNVEISDSEVGDLQPMFEGMLGFVQVIGSAVSVIIIAVVGIKYMWSSVEEKAEMKQTMFYYVIGAILIFTTVNVVSIAYNVFWS